MNLLFLNTGTKKYYVLLIILSFGTRVFANDSIPDIKFKAHYESSDAYILYNYTDVYYSKAWKGYKRQTNVKSKVVVNNRSGVEKYAFLNLNKFISDHLRTVRVKTLKADGTVIKLDSTLVFGHQSDNEHLGQVNYPIPGVEPRDTIEISYSYIEYLNKYELKDFVNLYSQLPSLNTEYTITTPPSFSIKYKTYNGFPEPQVIRNDTLIYCLFKMERIKGLEENQYTCLSCDLPYVYYSVDNKKVENRTWKELYNQEYNFITQPFLLDYENSSYYKRWKRKVIGKASDSTKYDKLNLLLKDIFNNIQIVPIKEGDMIKSSGYFLKNKRIDPISIRRLYRHILEDLEIGYWAVFARSKRLGEIDPYYIRKGEYDHIFFAFENSKGALSFLYPHNESFKYLINEIPTSLYNTDAIIAKPHLTEKVKRKDKFIKSNLEMAKVDSLRVNIIKLPGLTSDHNYLKQIVFCDVNVKEKETTFKSNFSASGGLSTDIRSFYTTLYQNKEVSDFYDALTEYEEDKSALDIDTVTSFNLKHTKPFLFKVNAQGSLKNSLTFLNDSMIIITLENLIQHSQVESESDSADLNYYLDYSYGNFHILTMNFPSEIEILGFDDYKKELKNMYGEYSFNLYRSRKNQFSIHSYYKILKDRIPKDEFGQLKQLNDLVQEIKNTRLLVKLIKPLETTE